MSAVEVLAVVGVIGYVVFRQVCGEPLRARRTLVLPVVLTVVGFTDLRGHHGAHLGAADVVCLAVGAAGSAAIGCGFGGIMRLEPRDGFLWARLPLTGLWLWVGLLGWRLLCMGFAHAAHAHVAASSATLLFSLGVNRLGQAAVVLPRALAAGVPFAPEQGGHGPRFDSVLDRHHHRR